MVLDLVLADNQSKEFSVRLKYLGYSKSLKPIIFQPKNISDFNKLKKLSTPDTLILGSSTDDKFIRRMLEDKRIDGIVDIVSPSGKEHTHYRRGNINQVLAKIALEKEKYYFVDFSRILKTPENKRYKLLGRIMQNIRIFQKYNVGISIASFAQSKYDLRSWESLKNFAIILGAKNVVNPEKIMAYKYDKSSSNIVGKNVKILNK